ncbi:MAG: hypothetical protein WBG86_06460 [Polyangiales bacterium]
MVVLGFSGSGGSTARVQVVRALKGRAEFEPRSAADAVIEERKLDVDRAAGRAQLHDALDVDYLFWGRVKGKGSGARTEIRVSGRSGKTLTGYEAGAPGTTTGNALIQEAARTALREVEEIAPPQGRTRKVAATTGVAARIETSKPVPAKAPEPTKPEKRAKPKQDSGRDDIAKLPVFEIMVGGGVRSRDINFVVGDGAGGTTPREFDSGAYADVGGYFLIRPLGRSDNRALQGLVIQGDGGVGFGLKAAPDGSGSISNIQTWRALGQLGYLYPIKRLQVGGLVGVGVDTFDIDLNSVLPSIQYTYVRVGGALAYTILPDLLGFRVDGGFRKPFSLGGIDAAFGNDSSAIGWDATAMVSGRLGVGFTYGFRFIFEGYKLDFAGANSNVPAMGGPGGNGTDRAFTYQFLVGWTI